MAPVAFVSDGSGSVAHRRQASVRAAPADPRAEGKTCVQLRRREGFRPPSFLTSLVPALLGVRLLVALDLAGGAQNDVVARIPNRDLDSSPALGSAG